MKMSIQFRKIKEVSAKLEPEKLYWPEAKTMLKGIGFIGSQAMRSAAPSGKTGALKSSISYKTNDAPRPLWVRFSVAATATPQHPGGRGGSGARGGRTKYPYPYGKRLEYEKKGRHYQWAHRALTGARPAFRSAINSAAQAIESKWSTP